MKALFAAVVTLCGVTALPAEACTGVRSKASAEFDSVVASWKLTTGHELVGRVYPISPEQRESSELLSQECPFMKPFDAVGGPLGSLLSVGEVHDNDVHHKIQSIFAERAKHIEAPVVFEQLRSDQQSALDAFADLQIKSSSVATLPEFKRLTGWDKSGWAKYDYDPLFQAVLDAKLPIYAGDVTRDAIMKAAKEGEAALTPDERTRLALDRPLGAKLDDASLTEIEDAHCNTMPKDALGGMAFAQRYRDASLADAVLKAAGKHGSAILIAGNGHVRTDRGVPWYIRQRAPDKKVVSVMLVEVEDGKNDPEAYVPRDPEGKPAADYIIFTPRADRGDPCEKMRAKLQKIQK